MNTCENGECHPANLVTIQAAAHMKRRLAGVDTEISRLHANGDGTDRDELLDERRYITAWFEALHARTASALLPTIVGVEASVVDRMAPSESDVPMLPAPAFLARRGDTTGP